MDNEVFIIYLRNNLCCLCLFRLGFEAPMNYNLSDFYIQTLAIVPHDREASLERVEVSPTEQNRRTYN